ncbi:hypothetical protein [Actinomadura flavalba]|uniref:hypothetical protein n=1 Tax=Actinomadura flavalba TaxID=1120938 RepID=UPI00036F7771|nr:hypothetical protein [Actinomadura flavalba]
MVDFGAPRYGRVPARVLLTGGPDGWHCEIIDEKDGRDRRTLSRTGAVWRDGTAPAWWGPRLAETAATLRESAARLLTDRAFTELGAEADVTWFVVDEPVAWEGLVTLRDPDPARFPGRVPPFVVALEPGRGAVLPDADLLFSTSAADAFDTLTAVAGRLASPVPAPSFICGYSAHRAIRVGRGSLSVAAVREPGGAERVSTVFGSRPGGWGGNPELRFRYDGIDLLDEPAADVVTLLRDLGHRTLDRHGQTVLPDLGLSLAPPPGGGHRFEHVALEFPHGRTDPRRLR